MHCPRARRVWLTLVTATLLVGAAVPLRAESDKAEALIREALDLRRGGDDQKAERLLREAHELSHSARSAAQLGFCEQALGSWVEAEVHIEEALHVPGDPWIKKNRGAIERSLLTVKTHIARVEVIGDPAGADALINGTVVGKLPLPELVPIAAGDVEIELRAPGYASTAKTLRMEGGQTYRIRLRAERADKEKERDSDRDRDKNRAGPPSVAATAAARPAMDLAAPQPSESETQASTGTSSGSSGESQVTERSQVGHADSHAPSSGAGRRSLKFVSWGLAAAGLGVGVYGVLRNSQWVSDFDSGCGIDAMGVPRASPGAPSRFSDSWCASLKRSYEQASTLGIVGLVAGGVFAAAGFVLWATEPSRAEAQTAGWTCAPTIASSILGRDRPQLACALRF
jgi:PEGA domain